MANNRYKKLFNSKEIKKYAKSICNIAKESWMLGLSDSTGFSISQIIPNTNAILVDKSGTGFRWNRINKDDLLLIDLEGNLLYQPNDKNPRMAPVNCMIHLEGYKNSDAKSCVHWHDPYTNAFACSGKTIPPFTLQSKLIGDTPCIMVDDRKYKKYKEENNVKTNVPSGLHSREDVYYVMEKAGEEAGKILKQRNEEFQRHGIVITHYEHGLFAFGRNLEEAFDNAYRCYRNAQAIIFNRLLS